MKFSIVIPQLFYDAIARVIPGAVFLILAEAYGTIRADQSLSKPEFTTLLETLGRGVELAIIACVIGWLLGGLTFFSQEANAVTTESPDGKAPEPPGRAPGSTGKALSLRSQDQWIRLANSEAGFRIVKLRAEIRMLEAMRTTFTLSALAGPILFIVKQTHDGVFFIEASCMRLVALSVFSVVA